MIGTTLSMLGPLQLLVWIIALEVVTIPLLVWLTGALFATYFREKEKHSGRMANAVGTALTKAANDNLSKIAEAIGKVAQIKNDQNKKEEKSDEG